MAYFLFHFEIKNKKPEFAKLDCVGVTWHTDKESNINAGVSWHKGDLVIFS